MIEKAVRISKITITNFKNVAYGTVSLENTRKNYKSSVLGLYGQNGSGKTALIDAIELLKEVLCGRPIPSKFADFINVGSDYSTLLFEFDVKQDGQIVNVTYKFSIRAEVDSSIQNTDKNSLVNTKKRVSVFDECVKCPILTDKQIKMGRLIDTNSQDVFGPRPKKILLIGKDKNINTDLVIAKRMAATTSRSFVFSRELLSAIRLNVQNIKNECNNNKELMYYYQLLEAVVDFGNYDLFVINTAASGLISLNAQPLAFRYHDGTQGTMGLMALTLDESVVIPEDQKDVVIKVVDNMNIVLKQIIPGLTVSVKVLGTQIMNDGTIGCSIQLMSQKNSKEIALKYESEGIKKIVSILQLLIVVYNQPSITVAVDELDAGVFEYLLGELLRIISEKGKGQLIFTSHNLRMLETLDKGFIAFTTTNPHNRYVRMTNVKETNNLRDFYYHDIMLGEQDEELYEQTHNSEIAFAFREAGELIGS